MAIRADMNKIMEEGMKIRSELQNEFDSLVKKRDNLRGSAYHPIPSKMYTGQLLKIVKTVVTENINDKEIIYPDILDDLWTFLYDCSGKKNTFSINDLEKIALYILNCITGEDEDDRCKIRKWLTAQSDYAAGIKRIRFNGKGYDGGSIYEIQYKNRDMAIFVNIFDNGKMYII